MPSIKPTGTHGYSGHGDHSKSARLPVENDTSIQHHKTNALGLQSIGTSDFDPTKKMINRVTPGNSGPLHLTDYVRSAFDNFSKFIKQILDIFLEQFSTESKGNEPKAVSLDPKLYARLRDLPVNSDEFALSYAQLNKKIADQEKFIEYQTEQLGNDDPNPEVMDKLLAVKAEANGRIDEMANFATQYMKGELRNKAITAYKRGIEIKGLKMTGDLVLPVVKRAEKTVVVEESEEWHLSESAHAIYNTFNKFIHQVADVFVGHHEKETKVAGQYPKLRERIRAVCVGGDIFNQSYAEVKKLIVDRQNFIAYEKEHFGEEDPEPEIMVELQSIKAEADKRIDEMANLCTRGLKGAVRAKWIQNFKNRIDNQENLMELINTVVKDEKALRMHKKQFAKVAVNDGAINPADYREEVVGNKGVTVVENYDSDAIGEADSEPPTASPPQSPKVPKDKSDQ